MWKIFCLIVCCVFCVSAVALSFCQSIEDVNIIRISPPDEAAVININGGRPRVIRVGDSLFDNATITDIQSNRIVIKCHDEKGFPETVVIRVTSEGQIVEHILSAIEERPARYMIKESIQAQSSGTP